MTEHHKIDPDPFVLIQTACAVVCAICSLGSLAIQYRSERTRLPADYENGFVEVLQDGLERSTKDVRKLIKFLSSANLGVLDPIDRKFKFGETALFLDYKVFGEFERISSSLIHNLDVVQKSSLHLVKHDPEWSVRFGTKIAEEITDFKERINHYYRGDLSNGEVLEDILLLFRRLEQLLGRMNAKN
ncbi:hypothetical protein A8A54_15490 [Brucella pseudogrignonensis]|uniref:hypothetical protein n=1 Tax=Brucella pseudogrignonensis TaxID=419475 RepID=UPI0007DAAC27|nr:hypothetical protein [Brucella pseudogrignonensis]ANG97760.1 hypothetical protein A8A54_15490 [Brucella pseudogrignonensis]